jgi:dihydrofolate reductase
MRKLKLQVQISLDGFIAGTNGEMDWLVRNWDDELKKYVAELTESIDCIVLGRKLAQGFIPYWASHPQEEGAVIFNSTKKVVFTQTLASSEWHNTVLEKGNLVDEITKLKEQDGQDLIAYGGASFVSSLIQHRLIDEFHFFINPSVIGNGMTIFKEVESKQDLKLIRSTSFDCGIVVLNYDLKPD